MKCCVQNCNNDDLKKTNKSKGITFHKLPKDPVQRAAWLKFLSETGYQASKRLIVCSDHFKPEDFDEIQPNQRRVNSELFSKMMAPVDPDQLMVCRVCLSSDVKMYDMNSCKLSEKFQNITGIMACDKENMLHHICWECAARLTAAAAFREKALYTDALLNDLVRINKANILILKENYASLKSPLSVHTADNWSNIESVHTIIENKNNYVSLNIKTDLKEGISSIINEEENETEYQEYEPWIDAPMKIEIETDPIAENDINIKYRGGSNDGLEVEVRNIDDNHEILSVNEINNVPADNNTLIVDDREQKPKLGYLIKPLEEESSSNEDTYSTADEKPVIKEKKKRNSKVGTAEQRMRITDRIKEKIIALKKVGCGVRAIAHETGLSVASVDRWWSRYRKNGYTYIKSSTVGSERDTKQNYDYNPAERGKEIGACSDVVRQRLHEAGFEHILMKKPEKNASTGQIISEHKALHDDLKQRIIALKQEGITNSRIAYLLDTSRITVRKWWTRWCDEGHMQNLKGTGRKRKTTPEEDQLLIQRVMQEQTVHTPSLAMELGISPECLRRRLKGAGFKHMERKAYVPLKAGRSHKVDEELKQQILSMKLNGVSVTDIANQFRVPRTTIYQWWQRWCKENNIKVTSDHASTATEGQGSAGGAPGEKSLQAPAIISSQKSLWQKIPDTKYVP